MPSQRVVVADDSRDMRELVSLVLCNYGFSVVGAADGEAALETILAHGADALVSDLCMPRLDGLALCRVLRTLRSYATFPIVVFTGAANCDHRLSSLRDISGLRLLSKPMGLREIAPALSEMLATVRADCGAGTPVSARALELSTRLSSTTGQHMPLAAV